VAGQPGDDTFRSEHREVLAVKSRIAVLFAGGMVVAAVVMSPTAARPAVAAGGGGTTISSNGSALTITVNIDLCCATSGSMQTVYGPLIEYEVKLAENQWNQALAKLPAKGCFPITVVFKEHLLKLPLWENGYHHIDIDFFHPGRSYSVDNTPGTTHNDDTVFVYEHETVGDFYDADMSGGTWAHEIGHLMGLGDDYTGFGGHGLSVPLAGRNGTLMANSSTGVIDQALADRLADIAAKSGLKLPPCKPTPNPCGGVTMNPNGAGVCR
jgi:hypothetical protein